MPSVRGRGVYTIVFNGDAVDDVDRVQMFVDGDRAADTSGTGIDLGTTLAIGDATMCIGNRPSGARSPQGSIFYTALYDTALTEAEVSLNSARLLADDD